MGSISLIYKLNRWPLLKKFATLAGGTTLAQGVTIAVTPILSRLYTPSDFGSLAVFTAVLSVLGLVATGRYELAITLPKDQGEALGTVGSAFVILGVSVLIITVVSILGVFDEGAPDWLHPMLPYKWLLPFSVLGLGLLQILQAWALRKQAYKSIAASRMRQSAGSAVVSLVSACFWSGAWGLMLGQLAQQWIGISKLSRLLFSPEGLIATADTIARGWLKALRDHAGFVIYSAGAGLLNLSSLILPPLILTALFDSETTGSFSFAHRLVALPMFLIGTAVSQVFLGETAAALRAGEGEVSKMFTKITCVMMLVAVALVLASLSAPWIFPVIFGPQWELSGRLVVWLALPCAAQLIVSPVSGVAIVLKRQKTQFLLDLMRTCFVCGSFVLSNRLGLGVESSVMIYAGAMVGSYIIYFILYYKIVKDANHLPASKI